VPFLGSTAFEKLTFFYYAARETTLDMTARCSYPKSSQLKTSNTCPSKIKKYAGQTPDIRSFFKLIMAAHIILGTAGTKKKCLLASAGKFVEDVFTRITV